MPSWSCSAIMSPLNEVVGPADCAFLVGIPITREAFLQALADPNKDFVHGQYGESPLTAEAKWTIYWPTAEAIGGLLDKLRAKRVQVIAAATLSEFVRAQTSARVVVLFTHWRSGLLRMRDIAWELLPAGTADAKLQKIVDLLRSGATGEPGRRTAIVASINELLINEALGDHPWFGLAPGQKAASPEHRVFMNRKFLDAALPGVFRSCTSVEFADGMVPITTVADAVRPDYTGILDLSVC